MIRVVIAEDHHIVREGVRLLLEKAGIEVVGEAADGHKAVELIQQLRPDVALMDISMPGLSGNQVIRTIKELRLPVEIVVLSMHSELVLVREALKSGARCYLHKRAVSQELLLAIQAAYHKKTYLSPCISTMLLDEMLDEKRTGQFSCSQLITDRELEVLQLIADGWTSQKIGQQLNIAVKTVENHRANMMKKLQVTNTARLIKEALKNKLISLDD